MDMEGDCPFLPQYMFPTPNDGIQYQKWLNRPAIVVTGWYLKPPTDGDDESYTVKDFFREQFLKQEDCDCPMPDCLLETH
jgi:hypothetical protein